ncbi:cobyric acid synthase, partial [Mycobacterium sp. UM_Kg1]|uniref:cobyric acid synthase n=1 Tax=Mycobacterium sp. UM_Kg1 TaxID=1545691 RepID=UPI00061AD81D
FFGTVALLSSEDQALVAGFIVNKFRGRLRLLEPGLADLERLTARRVFGTLPWHPQLWLDSEDALDLEGRRSGRTAARRVAVIRFPRISNFTDLDALGLEPDLDVVFAADPRGVTDADLVVLPGTRSTISDLAWLRSRGIDFAIAAHAAAGKPVLGICGGFQMLGRMIRDPAGIEGAPGEVVGLGLLDVETRFAADKVLHLSDGGYEIHHGRIIRGPDAAADDALLGGVRAGQVFGTMRHGCLEVDAVRAAFLSDALGLAPSGVSFPAARERRLDLLGDLIEEHLDVDALLELAGGGPPSGLPFLPPGAP